MPLDELAGAVDGRVCPRFDGMAVQGALQIPVQGRDRGIAPVGMRVSRGRDDRGQVASETPPESRISGAARPALGASRRTA